MPPRKPWTAPCGAMQILQTSSTNAVSLSPWPGLGDAPTSWLPRAVARRARIRGLPSQLWVSLFMKRTSSLYSHTVLNVCSLPWRAIIVESGHHGSISADWQNPVNWKATINKIHTPSILDPEIKILQEPLRQDWPPYCSHQLRPHSPRA